MPKRKRARKSRPRARKERAKRNPSPRSFSTIKEFLAANVKPIDGTRDGLDVFGEVVTIDYARVPNVAVENSGKPHYHDFDILPTAYYDRASKAVIIVPVDAGPVPRTR